MHIRSLNNEHGLILRGMASVVVFAAMGKAAGAAKEMAVAWRYGVSPYVDAYLFVFNLVHLPVAIWFSVLLVILVPLEARNRAAPDKHRLQRFRAEMLALTLILGGALLLVMMIGLPQLLSSSWVGLPQRTAQLGIEMVPVLSWLSFLGLLVGLYSTWMLSSGSHLNTLLEGLPALGILVGVLLTGGIEPLVWGVLAGTLVQLACVAIPVSRRGSGVLPKFSLLSPDWVPFWQGFGVMMVGQTIMSFTTIVDQFFAARLGEGAISELGYANRILGLALTLVATAITRATLPVFSGVAASARRDVNHLALRWSWILALVGVLAVGIGWVLSPMAVRLLFQRGTFSGSDTASVARLVRLGLFQLPFYFSSLVYVSLHSSRGRYKVLLVSSILGLTAKGVANYLLIPIFHVGGVMVALAVVYAFNAVFLATAAHQIA